MFDQLNCWGYTFRDDDCPVSSLHAREVKRTSQSKVRKETPAESSRRSTAHVSTSVVYEQVFADSLVTDYSDASSDASDASRRVVAVVLNLSTQNRCHILVKTCQIGNGNSNERWPMC